MAFRAKTRTRLKLVLITALAFVLTISLGYVIRKRQVATRVLRDRDAGYVALKNEEYFVALNKIGPFLQRNPNDVEALLKYADARSKVEEPNGQHILEAIAFYRRVLELEPENSEARHNLLDLYLSVGFNTEIVSMTKKRRDPDSLRARAIAMSNLGDKEALQTSQTYNEIKPDDLQMQIFTCNEMLRCGASPDQVVERAATLQQTKPLDPKFNLLSSFALWRAGRADAAKEEIEKVRVKLIDPELVDAAVQQLDLLNQYDESLNLLKQIAASKGDAAFRSKVIARLYQSGQFAKVLEQSSGNEADLRKVDVDLLGHESLALIALNRHAEADKIIQALASRKSDFKAGAWATVLRAIPQQASDSNPRRIIEACREGLRVLPDNPYFRLYLGDSYAQVGETQAAIHEWAIASQSAPVWPVPLCRILRVFAAAGYTYSLDEFTDKCAKLSVADPQSLAVVAYAKVTADARSNSAKPNDSLDLIAQVQKLQPGEGTTLGLEVYELALAGRADDARKLITAILDSRENPSQSALLSVAKASQDQHLGLEQSCFDRCRSVYGMTAALASAQALPLVASGRASQAVKEFQLSRSATPSHDDITWQFAAARLLDEASDPEAAKNWIQLADAHPDDLTIQAAALAARSTQDDRQLLRRCIDRLKAVVGDEGITWKLADARWIMQGAAAATDLKERDRQFVQAAAELNQLTRRSPDLLPARLLLADCLAQIKDNLGAVEQLATAARLAPQSLEISLQLASLLQASGDFDKAKPYLDRAEQLLAAKESSSTRPIEGNSETDVASKLASSQLADPTRDAAFRQLAALFAARGEVQRATEFLSKIHNSESDTNVQLAQLLHARGMLTDEICQKLLAKPTASGVGLVADYYASSGRKAEAEKILTVLDQLNTVPGEKETIRARYFLRFGSHDNAIVQLRAACTAAPSNRQTWAGLLSVLLGDGRADDAIEIASEARKAIPEDSVFSRIVGEAKLIRAVSDALPSRALLAILPQDLQHTDVLIKTLELIQKGRSENRTIAQVASDLKAIADANASLLPLQYLLIEMDARCGNTDEAISIATRSMQLAPADPQPAQRAVQVLAAAQRWDQLIGVATEWRQRLGANTAPADLMLARAFLTKGNSSAAENQLSPFIQAATKDPASWAELYPLYAGSLIGLGRVSEAQAFFEPALKVNAALRQGWMTTATMMPDVEIGAEWLRKVGGVIPKDAAAERVALSVAWFQLAQRSGDTADKNSAKSVLDATGDTLQANSSATSSDWLSVAMLKEENGDHAAAQAAYRQSLKLDPDNPVAQNNLAMLLLSQGGDPGEALTLAQRAAGHSESALQANFLDTLAQIQGKLGQYNEATASITQAVSLRPNDPDFRVNLIQLLLKSGKTKESQAALSELKTLVSGLPQPNPQLTERIDSLGRELHTAGIPD